MRPIFPGSVVFPRKPEIRFVHQRGGLQSMPGILTAHLPRRHTPEVLIYDGNQPFECVGIAAAPRIQKSCDLSRLRHSSHCSPDLWECDIDAKRLVVLADDDEALAAEHV